MTSKEIRQKYLDFFASKGHAILPSASIVPKEDPTVLFTTAGMQPLVPFLMGQKHPAGKRLANSQKCLRTVDIEEVGDNRHLSFFEMLGNWSLGDYFKKESIAWGFEFLTSPEWLGLDPKRLFVSVYKGYGDIPADEEAIDAWKVEFAKVGIEADVGEEYNFAEPSQNSPEAKYIYRINKKSGADNWWGLPYRGPCGPCSEVYYLLNQHSTDFYDTKFAHMTSEEIADFVDDQIVEIWNHVFMQFEGEFNEVSEPKNLVPLAAQNIDTGMGLERLVTVINGLDTAQKTDLLRPISQVVERYSQA
jgi:alanyl-tRNA synthetase